MLKIPDLNKYDQIIFILGKGYNYNTGIKLCVIWMFYKPMHLLSFKMQTNKFTFEEKVKKLKIKMFPANLKNRMKMLMRSQEFFLCGLE
jgi:hypothetical protein